MGCGVAAGENRAIEAAQKAISSPLLEGVSIKGAKNLLLNVTGSEDLTMQEIDEGNRIIYEAAGEEANVIFGWVSKEDMNEYVSYTVIATGFGPTESKIQSKIKDEKEKNKKKAESYFSGFSIDKKEENETVNLDEPTIFRVKGSKNILSSDEPMPQSGFKLDQLDAFERVEVKQNKIDEDDDEGSSFLRMMMD